MKREIAFGLIGVLLLFGCGEKGGAPASPVAIDVDGVIRVTADEFDRAFHDSSLKGDDPSLRKAFLEDLLTRKLILREAQRQGLDKNEVFLKDVESFWQQSLIKLTLDRKIKELALSEKVGDREIRDYYDAHRETDFADAPLEDAYSRIHWLLLRRKQGDAIDRWLDSLRGHSKVRIDYGLLNIEE